MKHFLLDSRPQPQVWTPGLHEQGGGPTARTPQWVTVLPIGTVWGHAVEANSFLQPWWPELSHLGLQCLPSATHSYPCLEFSKMSVPQCHTQCALQWKIFYFSPFWSSWPCTLTLLPEGGPQKAWVRKPGSLSFFSFSFPFFLVYEIQASICHASEALGSQRQRPRRESTP